MNLYFTHKKKQKIDLYLYSALLFYLGYLIYVHFSLIMVPFQLEYREGAFIIQIDAILRGYNIYSVANLPSYYNPYGGLYNYIAAIPVYFFGNFFPVLRLVSAFAIFLSSLLIYIITYRRIHDRFYSLCFAVIFYVNSLYFVIPQARPDSLGLFLFTLGFYVVEMMPFNIFSSTLIFLISVLGGLFCKIYFLLIGPIAFSFWTIFISFKKGVILSFFYIAAFFLTFFFINYFSPGYISSAIYSTLSMGSPIYSSGSWAFVYDQLIYFFKANIGLVALFLFSLIQINFIKIKKEEHFFPLYSLSLLLFFFVFLFGHGQGNFLTYIIELCLVPLIISSATLLELSSKSSYNLILKVFLIVLVISSSGKLIQSAESYKKYTNEFYALENEINKYDKKYGSPLITYSIYKSGQVVFDTGHNEYLKSITEFPNIFKLGIPRDEIASAFKHHKDEINSKVESGYFDLIVLDEQMVGAKKINFANLNKKYHPSKSMYVGAWKLDFWIRKEHLLD